MATATYKKFDVKHGISVNGLPFVDGNRNVTVNDLTVRGVSTIVDTRTISSIDPVISLGNAGQTIATEALVGDRIKFSAEAFSDIAIGDAITYNSGDITGLTTGTTYYVINKEIDPTSSNYRTITISTSLGGTQITGLSESSVGGDSFTLNPLRDLDQDLGIEFNYVSSTAKKGFFGYQDSTGNFTFLLDATYSGSSSTSDSSSPIFTGTKGGVEVKYIKLQPTAALTASTPAIDISQTWNDISTTFSLIDANVTDSGSASSSELINISVGSLPKFLVRKDGALAINTGTIEAALTVAGVSEDTVIYGSADWTSNSIVYTGIDLQITETSFAAGSKLLNISGGAGKNFSIDALGEITSNISFTSGNLETAIKVDVTDVSSASDSLLLDLQVGSASKFSVDKDGDIVAAGSLTIEGSATFNGTASVEDSITLEAAPNGTGTYEQNAQLQTSLVTIIAGSSVTSTISSYSSTSFVTGKYLVQMKQGSNYHSAEVLLLHAGSTVYMTEYASVYSSSIVGLLDAAISGGNVILTLTPTSETVANNAEIEVRVMRTTMAE
jgi:hypothetical protein